MHQQLPRVSHLQARHPDLRKPSLDQQPHQVLRIPPVRLLLAYYRGPDLGRIAEPQLHAQLRQQPLEPRILPARLHPYPHLLPRQRAVKLLRFRPVLQPFLCYLSRSIVKDRDLLKPRMKITAYNQHDVGSSHEPWSCCRKPLYSRRANVVMQSSEV